MRVSGKSYHPTTVRPKTLLTLKQVIDILQTISKSSAAGSDWAVITENNQVPEFRLHPIARVQDYEGDLVGAVEIAGINITRVVEPEELGE